MKKNLMINSNTYVKKCLCAGLPGNILSIHTVLPLSFFLLMNLLLCWNLQIWRRQGKRKNLSGQKSFTGKPKQRRQQLMHRERRRSLDASTLSMPDGLPPLCQTVLIVFWHIMSKTLSLYLSISPSLPLSLSLSIYLSISPCLPLSLSLSLYLSVSPSLFLSLSLSLYLSIYLSLPPSFSLSLSPPPLPPSFLCLSLTMSPFSCISLKSSFCNY